MASLSNEIFYMIKNDYSCPPQCQSPECIFIVEHQNINGLDLCRQCYYKHLDSMRSRCSKCKKILTIAKELRAGECVKCKTFI